MGMDKKVIGVYDNGQDAVREVERLQKQGYQKEDISVVVKDKEKADKITSKTNTNVDSGLAAGATTGGILGGLTGLLAGVGALIIPGIGPIVAAGPIATTLGGIAAGAGAGGLTGALVGLGIPKDTADKYATDVEKGKILILVDSESQKKYAARDTYERSDDPLVGAQREVKVTINPATGGDPNLRGKDSYK
ncbi:hypothetical protein F7984_02995 [Pradoshia sp. D12]|nr:hypothetical protein F7984_02995 [Pradoshia sp. D12]TPF71075.1 hypothetical protein FHY44_15170 [Bacillus sp. D12]